MKKIVTFVLAACAMLTALYAGSAEKTFYFIVCHNAPYGGNANGTN